MDYSRRKRASSKVSASKKSRYAKTSSSRFSNNIVPKSKSRTYIQGELKQIEVNVSPVLVSGTAQVIPLNLIATGDDYLNRDGRSIVPVSLKFRGTYTLGANSTNMRSIVFMDRGTGTLPAVAELLRTGTQCSDPINLDNAARFTIIKDQFFTGITNLNSGVNSIDWYLKFPQDIECKYTGTAANQASLGSNAIYIMMLQDSGNNVTPAIDCDFRFKDL